MSAISFSLLTFTTSHPSNRSFFTMPNAIPPFPSPFTSHYSPTFKPLRVSATESSPLSETTVSQNPTVVVENDDALDATAFVIRARNRIGLLQVITRVFKVLGIRIEKAVVEFEGEFFVKRFFVTDSNGKKIEERENLDRIEKALLEAISGDGGGGGVVASTRGVVMRRAGFVGNGNERAKAERMFGLMEGFLKNDSFSLQKDILDQSES